MRIKGAMSLEPFLQANPTVKFIHYQWVDLGGVLRAFMLTTSYALSLAKSNSAHNVSCLTLRLLPTDDFSPRFRGLLRDRLFPDWNSLRLARYMGDGKTHATVMCAIEETEVGGDGKPVSSFDCCPRTVLRRALEEAKEKDGLEFLIGFEVEFHLLDLEKGTAGEESTTIDLPSGWCSAASLEDERALGFLDEIGICLLDSGVKLRALHAEAGKGHFEVNTDPLDPMEAIDELVYIRRAVVAIARRHGYQATLYPTPIGPKQSTNGAHCHFSINKASDEMADKFLAGYLGRLPALCAFGMASYDSYHRISELAGQSGKYIAWATENKDLPVRKILGRTGYWEFRSTDFTANPYAQLAATITAGCLGLRQGEKLRWNEPPGKSASSYPKSPSDQYDGSVGDVLEPRGPSSIRGGYADAHVTRRVARGFEGGD